MRLLYSIIAFLLITTAGFAQTYEDFIQKSYDFVDEKDLPAAEECLKSAMRLEPANPLNYALLTNLGTIQRRQGKMDEALISYSSALSGHSNNITILENRASLYTELGEAEKALNDYNTLLFNEPEHQESLFCRGLLYIQLKNFIWAEEDFDKLLELNNKSVRARMGHAILEKMRGNYDESERIYNYLINEMPREWILYEGRAELYFMMGKNARAMADIDKVIVESGPSAAHYVLRGKIKLAQYEKERAAIDFKKAESMGYNKEVIAELMKLINTKD